MGAGENIWPLLLLLPTVMVTSSGDVWRGCEHVIPIWNKINGKPLISLNKSHGSQLVVSWSKYFVIHGSRCTQAFEVEYRQFGPGRLGWSVWSSVAACAILVQNPMGASNFSCTRDLADIDCEKRMHFRVVLHNIFNANNTRIPSEVSEAFIQCKEIEDVKIRRRLRPKAKFLGRKLFFVRTPHRRRFKSGTERPRTTTTPAATTNRAATPTAATASTTTAVMHHRTSPSTSPTTPVPTTTMPRTATTSAHPGVEYHEDTEEHQNLDPSTKTGDSRKGTLMLLPGKYSSIQTKKAYEVRENLRNFTARKQELSFCSIFLVSDTSNECIMYRNVYAGMQPCLLMSSEKRSSATRRKFKMLLNPSCEGRMELLRTESDCRECKEDKTFIVM